MFHHLNRNRDPVIDPLDIYYAMLEEPHVNIDAASRIVENLSGADRTGAINHILKGGIAEWDKLPEPWRRQVQALREKGRIPTATRKEIENTGRSRAEFFRKKPEDIPAGEILRIIAHTRVTPRRALNLLSEEWDGLSAMAFNAREAKSCGEARNLLTEKRAKEGDLILTFDGRFPAPHYPGNLRTSGIEAVVVLHDTHARVVNALLREGTLLEELDFARAEANFMARELTERSKDLARVLLF